MPSQREAYEDMAERMADFVHDGFLDRLSDQLIGQLVPRLKVRLDGQGHEGQAEFVVLVRTTLAKAGADRPELVTQGGIRVVGTGHVSIIPAAGLGHRQHG